MTQIDDKPINLLEILDGISFPVQKRKIILYAQTKGASDDALELLRAIPEKQYGSIQNLNSALGLISRQPGSENLWSSQNK